MSFVDFPAIKEAIDMEMAIEFLGLHISGQDNPNQVRAPCPACKRGGDRALSISTEKNVFTCMAAKHAGQRTGSDVIALVAHVRGVGMREAGELLQEQFLTATDTRTATRTSTSSQRREPQENKKAPATPGLTPLDYLDHAHEAVEALGLSADDAERLGAGYAGKGVLRGLVAIPLRTEDGLLVGYLGCSEGRTGKLHFPNIVQFPQRRRA
jgi:hypothetical protein